MNSKIFWNSSSRTVKQLRYHCHVMLISIAKNNIIINFSSSVIHGFNNDIHTGFHSFTEIGRIFHDKYTFNNKTNFPILNLENGLDSPCSLSWLQHGNWSWWNNSPLCKASSGENTRNRPISCLYDSETHERGLKGFKIQQMGGGAAPRPPDLLETCTFGDRLENWSWVFILDSRLNVQAVYVELV